MPGPNFCSHCAHPYPVRLPGALLALRMLPQPKEKWRVAAYQCERCRKITETIERLDNDRIPVG